MEHRLRPSFQSSHDNWDTCESYYSNVGHVRESVSRSEMTVTSAKRGYRDEDHLSKLERRALKKSKQEDWDLGELQFLAIELKLSAYVLASCLQFNELDLKVAARCTLLILCENFINIYC